MMSKMWSQDSNVTPEPASLTTARTASPCLCFGHQWSRDTKISVEKNLTFDIFFKLSEELWNNDNLEGFFYYTDLMVNIVGISIYS